MAVSPFAVIGGGSSRAGKRLRGGACALATAIALALAPGASAAPGQIDPAFGPGGIARLDLGPTFKDIRFETAAVQPDGSVLAVRSHSDYPPDSQIRRYQANGQLDPGSPPRRAADFEVALADGDTLAVTELCCPSKLRLQRRNADGSPDPGFAEGGERTIPIPFSPRKVVPLANGKILLAGIGIYLSSTKAPPINQVGVARLNANGSLDQSFSEDGVVWLRGDHEVVGTDAGALTGRPGDGILVAVNATASTFGFDDTARGAADSEATLVGLTAGGGLDQGFGDRGAVKLSGSIAAAHVLADGAILAAGTKRGEKIGCCYAQSDFWAGRFTPAGAPDPAFGGGDGAATADLSAFDVTETALWAEDGSTLVGGSTVASTSPCVQLSMCEEAPALVRFSANGELDPAFGEGGGLRLQALANPVRGSAKGVLALAARSGGGAVAAGSSGPAAFLAAIGPNGALDPGFGAAGIVAEREPLPSGSSVEAVAVDGQGRILLAGTTEAGATEYTPNGALVRTLPDGRLDPGFGEGRGYVEVPFEGSDIAIDEQERAVVLDRNGRWLTRVTAAGTIDSSFGEGGIVLPAAVLGLERLGLRSVASLPGGGMLVAGSLVVGRSPRVAVVRLRPDGSIDRSFGRGGIVVRGFGRGRPCAANRALVQPDGRILLAGYVGRPGKEARESSTFALMRLLPDGSPDPGFGRGGRLASRIRGSGEATDLALRGGRILATGWLRRPGKVTTLLRRYRASGRLDRGFERGGPPRPSTAAKAALWPRAISLLSTPSRIVVSRGTSTRPVLAFRRNGRLDRSYARGANLVPGRLAEHWATPAPLLASQAGAPILAWTAWEPAGGGARRQTIALRRLLAR
jgi:uncharacterized delta-60 repeat protein